MDSSQAASLLAAVELLQSQPELLHTPELAFFRDYVQSLGATIPAQATEPVPEPAFEDTAAVDLDLTDVVSDEATMAEYVEGQPGTEGDREACMDLATSARQQLSSGNVEEAIGLLNQAVLKAGDVAR
jgi:suppressor of tumorigenicity protein 13